MGLFMGSPCHVICPSFGCVNPEMILRKVDLPDPDLPSKQTISFSNNEKSI